MLHLFLDNLPDGQSTRLLFFWLIHRLHIFVIRIITRIKIMVVVLFEYEVLGGLLLGGVGLAAVDDTVSCAGDFLVVGELGVLHVLGLLVAHQ